MSRVSKIVVMVAVVVLVGAGAAFAQTTTQRLEGTVLNVSGDTLVVKMADGTVREFHPQPGFTFLIDGKATPVSELKPGTKLVADVTTTEESRVVVYEEVRSGKVLEKVGQTLVVRLQSGEVKKFTNVSDDVKFTVDGNEITIFEIKPGMNLDAHIITEQTEIVTDRQVVASGSAPAAPAAPAKPAPVAAPAPAPAPAAAPAELPHTASSLPLVGLAGLALLVLGLGLGIIRRF
jgi:hypothetical protein